MELKTNDNPTTRELTAQIKMTDMEIHSLAVNIPNLIVERLIDVMVKELLPLMTEQVHIDWKQVSEGVEKEISRRIADVLQPEKK